VHVPGSFEPGLLIGYWLNQQLLQHSQKWKEDQMGLEQSQDFGCIVDAFQVGV
jgi:hypothetical protein